jgi:predicted nucleic acid-binding Zn ribbon protein
VNLGVKTYLTSITAALEVTMINDMHLAVWSRTKEALEWVTSLQCGDVLDTQRRRRDQLIETFNVLTYP